MDLFAPDLPDGFRYQADFITADDERALATEIEGVAFDTFEMRGVVARRRVKFYGASYGGEPSPPIPAWLESVRARAAAWAGIAPDAFAMALINEYRPGAAIGWHRDAPQYGLIAGISLLSSCRMKLRPYVAPADLHGPVRRAPRKTTHEIALDPRSGYLITDIARSDFEHSIPATTSLRYSVTFRTLR